MDLRNNNVQSPDRELRNSLRCPDCASGPLAPVGAGKFQCGACGRVLEFSGNLLRALPAQLAAGAQANLNYYDALARDEAEFMLRRATSRNHIRKTRMVMETLGLDGARKPLRVLELGMGFGSHGDALTAAGHDYVGLDISEGNLRRAMTLYPRLEKQVLVEGDAERLPFQD